MSSELVLKSVVLVFVIWVLWTLWSVNVGRRAARWARRRLMRVAIVLMLALGTVVALVVSAAP